MKRYFVPDIALGCVFLLVAAVPVHAMNVGQGTADQKGIGSVCFDVDSTQGADALSRQIQPNVQFSEPSTVKSVSVEKGKARVDFQAPRPGSTVEVQLPDAIAKAIGAGKPVSCDRAVGAAAAVGIGAMLAA